MSRARQLADSADLSFDDGTLVVDSANNRVGIGTSSPSSKLELNNDSFQLARFRRGTSGSNAGIISFVMGDNTEAGHVGGIGGGGMQFRVGDSLGTEAMRIDSSGNLLVGTTSASSEFTLSGRADITNAGLTQILNRTGSDGDITLFRKDGTTVGSIGVRNGHPSFGNTDTGIELNDFSEAVQPFNTSTNSTRDAAIDLGVSGARFKDLYLSGGVYLGGTGSANKLDDYEEGTFTPNLPNIIIGNGSVSGLYTKIGSLVMVQIFFVMGSTTNFGGSFFFDNAPFAASGTLANQYGLMGNLLNSGSDNYVAYGRVTDGSTNGLVYYPETSGGSGTPNAVRVPNTNDPFTWAANDKIECGFVYYTDS